MIIRELTPCQHQKYDRLSVLYGSVFTTLQWVELFGKDIKNYGIYDAGDNLIGGFFIFTEKKYGFSVYCNPPLTPSIGPFFKNDSINPVRAMDKCKQIISLIAEFIDRTNYSVVSLSFDRNIIDMQPFAWRDYKVTPQYTYIIQLALPVEDIWKRMSNERRNDITRGLKDGLIVKQTDDHKIIKSLVIQTFSRQNKTIDDFYINKILFDFANTGNSFAFVTFANGNPIACTFCVYDNNTAYYILGGYNSENKHHGAGALCVWEAIQYAKNLGLAYFDFEGSMVPAIERYFRGFGGELVPYYRVNKAKLPLEIALKFFKRQFF